MPISSMLAYLTTEDDPSDDCYDEFPLEDPAFGLYPNNRDAASEFPEIPVIFDDFRIFSPDSMNQEYIH